MGIFSQAAIASQQIKERSAEQPNAYAQAFTKK